MHYILNPDHSISPAELLDWAKWLKLSTENGDRFVRRTQVEDYLISTVFLGINHNFGKGPPLLFETMIFNEKSSTFDHYQTRCATYDEALEMHERAVKWVQDRILLDLMKGKNDDS